MSNDLVPIIDIQIANCKFDLLLAKYSLVLPKHLQPFGNCDRTLNALKARVNYQDRQFILQNDFNPDIQEFNSCDFKCVLNPIKYDKKYRCKTISLYYRIKRWVNSDPAHLMSTYYKNVSKKMYRVEKRLNEYRDYCDSEHHLYFCTITLQNKNINHQRVDYSYWKVTSDVYDQVRKKLRKHIKNFSDVYLFNKDFGLTHTKRLHFHGVALFKDSEIPSLKRNTKRLFGKVCSFKLIDENSDLIAKYINKLSYHALKVNYGKFKENLIYSRNISKSVD